MRSTARTWSTPAAHTSTSRNAIAVAIVANARRCRTGRNSADAGRTPTLVVRSTRPSLFSSASMAATSRRADSKLAPGANRAKAVQGIGFGPPLPGMWRGNGRTRSTRSFVKKPNPRKRSLNTPTVGTLGRLQS